MNWTTLFFEILGSILTVLFTSLTGFVISWISLNIKDKKLQKFLLSINNIIVKNVKYIYQTYVEELKNKNLFDTDAQNEALCRCKELIFSDFTNEMKDYIMNNFGDVTEWITNQIETTIYDLKGGNK